MSVLTTIVNRQFKEDRTLCPIQALRYYLDRTKDLRGSRSLLFISVKKGHTSDIRPTTFYSWLKQTILLGYKQADQQSLDLVQVKGHDIRAFAVSKLVTVPHNTFTNFYIKDLTWSDNNNNMYLGPVAAAQQVLDPSRQTSQPHKEERGGGGGGLCCSQVFRSLIPRSRFIQQRDFRNIRQFLTEDAAVSVANAFVSSQLDYCNSLSRSLSKFSLHRLQSIQNSAARIVINSSIYTWITLVLRKLHGSLFSFAQSSNWLPWCTCLFILVSLNILLQICPHTALLTILDIVLPISSMCPNFNLQFTSPLSSLASVLPLMLPLFGIHFLKTFVHHPLLPLLQRS